MTLPSRLLVIRSPSTMAASSATQAGVVNSSANTVANGRSVTASDQLYWPKKCVMLRAKWNFMKRGATCGRSSAPHCQQQQKHDEPGAGTDGQDFEDGELLAERTDRQRAHRKRQERAGHPCGDTADVLAGHDYSASGWFSGRALSKAGSFMQRGVGRDKLRKCVKRNLEPSRVVDLRHKVDVGQRDVAAEAVGTGLDHRFERSRSPRRSSDGTRRRFPAARA